MMWSGAQGRRPRLVVRSYDGRDGVEEEDRYSLNVDDASSPTAPWGHGLVGYVAETRVVLRLDGSSYNMVSHLLTGEF